MRTRWIGFAAASALSLGLLVPAAASAQTPIVLDGTIPDGTPRYFAIPFTVPDGIHEIEVSHDDMSDTNILDWGLRDPARFRGWGGGNTENAVVGDMAASRSYLPGAIPAGQWAVLVGQAKVVDAPAHYHIEITLRAAPTLAAQTARAPYTPVAALATGPRWYAGDFHVHSLESGDASPTIDAIATFARGRGLDFVELSDHNTVSQMDFINDVQSRHPDLLLVPGFEYTTYWGHANAIGATQWVDFMIASTPSDTIEAGTDGILSQGAVMSINHPVLNLGNTCIGCAWMLMEQQERIGAVEIENGQYSVSGAAFYHPSMVFWESFLSRGLHVAPLGGSDDHSGGTGSGALYSPIAGPTTMVYARELSVAAIMEGVRAGHTVVKLQGPTDPMVELSAGTAIVGDTVHDRHVTLSVTVTHGMGGTLQFVHNGMTQTTTVAVDADPFTTTLPVDAPPGTQEDRWRCQLLMNNRPSVVTGHLWVAATGDPIPQDAGAPTDASAMGDAGAMDAANPGMDAGSGMHAGGGCGCATVPAKSPAGLGALAMLGLLAVRRRRKQK